MALVVDGVEAVPLGEEVLQRARLRRCGGPLPLIADAKASVLGLVSARAPELDTVLIHVSVHLSEKIWEPVEAAGALHCEPAGGIQREEVDPRLAAEARIGPDV